MTNGHAYNQDLNDLGGVGIILIEHGAYIWLCQRTGTTYYRDLWQLPGGGADRGECRHGAALRELEEETGLRLASLTYVGRAQTEHPGKPPEMEAQQFKYWEAFFAAEFDLGAVRLKNTEPDKHSDWQRFPLAAFFNLPDEQLIPRTKDFVRRFTRFQPTP